MLEERLLSMQDIPYRDFQRRLIPGIDPEKIIGVRTAQLRRLARQLRGTQEAADFMAALPHRFFEENQVHAFLIAQEKEFDRCLALVDDFLPYVDNWATCDQLSPKALRTDLPRLMRSIRTWLASDHPYTVRFGVNCLMQWVLADAFDPAQLDMVAALRHEDYYVRLAVAWYFATALALQYDAALPYIVQRRLEPWTHNKAIQKATESFRVLPEHKETLRALKIRRENPI
ncbi:MAG: DNA alkylation repair protein [Candidatus Ventricola sp.]